MADSSIGFFLFLTIAFILLIIPYLINRYVNWRKLPIHAHITVAVSFLFALSYVIVLCPLDLTVTMAARCNLASDNSFNTTKPFNSSIPIKECFLSSSDVDEARTAIEVTYKISFWIVSILLGWIVMGIQSSYLYSCEFTPISKLKAALRENIYYYVILLVIAVPIFIGIWSSNGISYAIGYVFAISNFYSLFCITLLMSYGLINIPRILYCKFRRESDIQRISFEAWSLTQQRHDSEYELKQKLAVVTRLEKIIPAGHGLFPFLEEIRAEIPDSHRNLSKGALSKGTVSSDELDIPDDLVDITESHLAHLRAIIRDCVHNYTCTDVHFNKLVNLFIHYEDIDLARKNNTGVIEWSSKSSDSALLNGVPFFSSVEYFWYIYFKPAIFAVLFVLAVAWSCFTIVAEISLISGRTPNLSVLSYVFDALYSRSASSGTDLFVLLFMMGYQVLATFFTLFTLKIGKFYHIYSEKQSTNDQLVNSAFYLARFAPSLVQNFLNLLREDASGGVVSSFTQFYGSLNLIPFLGPGIDTLFPLLLGVMIIITWFGQSIYTKYLKDCHFVLLDWVDDHIVTDDRISYGTECLSHAARRLNDSRGSGINSNIKLRIENTSGPLLSSKTSSSSAGYIEMNESETLDVDSYLKSVRQRHEAYKNKTRT